MKKCFECGELKDLSQFPANIGREDGLNNECIECASEHIPEHTSTKICSICLKTFGTKHLNTKYCSLICKKQAVTNRYWQNREKKLRYQLRYKRKNTSLKSYNKICAFCNKAFTTDHSGIKYCSQECSQQAQKIHSRRYYLLKHGWNILRFQVFERDGFKCQYCGRIPWKHNVALVVDHMKPKIKDGQNIPINLITSCEECNASKGPRNLLDERLLRTIKKRTEKYLEKIDKNQIVAKF